MYKIAYLFNRSMNRTHTYTHIHVHTYIHTGFYGILVADCIAIPLSPENDVANFI